MDVFRLELNTAEAAPRTQWLLSPGDCHRCSPIDQFGGPLQVDAFGVRSQLRACIAVGLSRVVLVSSLCAGRWRHPRSVWADLGLKRLGERWGRVAWIDGCRPGGLSEDDNRTGQEGVVFSGADQQQSSSIPRRLVAQVCLDALQGQELAAASLKSPVRRSSPSGGWVNGCWNQPEPLVRVFSLWRIHQNALDRN